jgi:hypothetical protein
MTGQADQEIEWFSRTRITRREAISFLAGGTLTAALAIFFIATPKSQVPTDSGQSRQATVTTTTPSHGGGGNPSSSLMIHSVLATTAIETELIPPRN